MPEDVNGQQQGRRWPSSSSYPSSASEALLRESNRAHHNSYECTPLRTVVGDSADCSVALDANESHSGAR
jgi:hypothetical protein